jgi:hypothetical protein
MPAVKRELRLRKKQLETIDRDKEKLPATAREDLRIAEKSRPEC